ncbi:hypothetical protein DPEC_G00168740 [Dallia pectoralis]|uniref:Uncharacterized protein n=1 Tax=Dallia pectoralis TaxID=75939 RepID=A0ACC2GCU9_DALPE|nr:hypothetical protein DPEC_G00168740 [Dallia pectoralis]
MSSVNYYSPPAEGEEVCWTDNPGRWLNIIVKDEKEELFTVKQETKENVTVKVEEDASEVNEETEEKGIPRGLKEGEERETLKKENEEIRDRVTSTGEAPDSQSDCWKSPLGEPDTETSHEKLHSREKRKQCSGCGKRQLNGYVYISIEVIGEPNRDQQTDRDMSSLNNFTPAREDELMWMGNPCTVTGPQSNRLNGEETRRFYQSLIEEEHVRGDCWRAKGERRGGQPRGDTQPGRGAASERGHGQNIQASRQQASRPQANTTSATELEGLRLLRCAQEGDLSGVRGQLSRGVDVNFQDGWWWTGLMCAAAAGQRGVVKLLLQEGAAWVGVVDTQGRDARELARKAGHHGVVEELDRRGAAPDDSTDGHGQPRRRTRDHNYLPGEMSDHGDHSSPPAARAVRTHQNQSHWCPDCKVHYSCPQDTHWSSTLHLFSLSRSPPTPQYCLNPTTPAYQMMLRSGWTPGDGLGPEGVGPKQPVRTVLKRDSKGLGYGPTPRPKVTHFQARDPRAVKRTGERGREGRVARSGRKVEERDSSRRREERDRNWERDFRSSFNTFDP